MVKVQARIEKEYFKAREQYELKRKSIAPVPRETIVRLYERVKTLEWVLSDLNNDLV